MVITSSLAWNPDHEGAAHLNTTWQPVEEGYLDIMADNEHSIVKQRLLNHINVQHALHDIQQQHGREDINILDNDSLANLPPLLAWHTDNESLTSYKTRDSSIMNDDDEEILSKGESESDSGIEQDDDEAPLLTQREKKRVIWKGSK